MLLRRLFAGASTSSPRRSSSRRAGRPRAGGELGRQYRQANEPLLRASRLGRHAARARRSRRRRGGALVVDRPPSPHPRPHPRLTLGLALAPTLTPTLTPPPSPGRLVVDDPPVNARCTCAPTATPPRRTRATRRSAALSTRWRGVLGCCRTLRQAGQGRAAHHLRAPAAARAVRRDASRWRPGLVQARRHPARAVGARRAALSARAQAARRAGQPAAMSGAAGARHVRRELCESARAARTARRAQALLEASRYTPAPGLKSALPEAHAAADASDGAPAAARTRRGCRLSTATRSRRRRRASRSARTPSRRC